MNTPFVSADARNDSRERRRRGKTGVRHGLGQRRTQRIAQPGRRCRPRRLRRPDPRRRAPARGRASSPMTRKRRTSVHRRCRQRSRLTWLLVSSVARRRRPQLRARLAIRQHADLADAPRDDGRVRDRRRAPRTRATPSRSSCSAIRTLMRICGPRGSYSERNSSIAPIAQVGESHADAVLARAARARAFMLGSGADRRRRQ